MFSLIVTKTSNGGELVAVGDVLGKSESFSADEPWSGLLRL